MGHLKKQEQRTNLAMVWVGIACLLISAAGALGIWFYPHTGPDMRREFCMVLVPGWGIGVTFTLLGMYELRALKKRAW